ncbi:uncharacterized protein LOC127101366 isoform X2 [Lathyrus oleraceus]|uniref:Uncharacterized protein n=1 Tax=Pisum sativum TaxID=3888 RepID=A0A9D4ZZL5_PEA|nr:uncharacterized protein LOC127101366 isoform X2 [Pisum sativum]KAI5387920.1 hypothetical protein KIW84_073859 [Pisum sativum]
MEFHGLSRKELQALCKRNKIPANMTNVAMADALAALPQVEGLGEIVNPKTGGDIATPAVQPRTAGRTTTQRKPVKESESSKISTRPNRGARSGVVEGEAEQENKDANVSNTPAVVPCSRKRAPAVSTRRKTEVVILDDDEEEDKNEVDENPKDVVAKTPAVVPKSRTRAAGRLVRDKKEVSDGTSLQNAYSTRRSVRVLGKSLSKVSLVETEDKEQTKSEDVSEDGTSFQTESNAVSQNNDEVEASSVNKAGSEAKAADAEDVLQAEPKVEGSGNANHVEDANEDPSLNLQDSFENCVDSNEAESEQPEPEESGDIDVIENKESFGAEQDQAMEFAAPEETPLEVTDRAIEDTAEIENKESFGAEQDQAMEFASPEETPLEIADPIGNTAEIENKESFGAKQDQAMEFASPEETPLEVADQAIGALTDVVSGDISMEVANQEDDADLSVEASEEAFKGTAEQAIVGLSVEASDEASKEISHQVIASSTDMVSDEAPLDVSHLEDVADLSAEASEEVLKGTVEQAIVGLSVEAPDEASKEICHQAIASSTDVVTDDASKETFKETEELASVGLSVESSEEASKEISPVDVVVPDDACVDNLEGVADMVFEEVENIEDAVSAILAGKDETSGRAENEGDKESEIEKVILKLSMMDVTKKKEADRNNAFQKLEGEAQAEQLATEENPKFEGAVSAILAEKAENEGEKESNDVEKVTLKLSMMDVSSVKKEADQNNTSQKLEVEAQAEEPICSPQLETKGKLKTKDMSMRSLKKLLKSGTKEISNEIKAVTSVESDMNKQLLKSETKEISNEIEAVTSVESDMNNPNKKKENLKSIDVQNMSMRGLKKLLKEKLDGKLAMTDNDDVQMQGVEKKRTALQALPQNQLAEQKAL